MGKKNIELRSKKVQAILGEIPASLEHFSLISICVVILCIISIVYFIPYKQVYSGTIVIHDVNFIEHSDSIETNVLLRFDVKKPNNVDGQLLYLQAPNGRFAGRILNISTSRDTLGYYNTVCCFKTIEIKSVENQTTDFQIILSVGNLLCKIFDNII